MFNIGYITYIDVVYLLMPTIKVYGYAIIGFLMLFVHVVTI